MEIPKNQKSTIEEIRLRFDRDVERFSNLETGQQTTIDAQISLELITDAAKAVNPNAKTLLDIGCGAGNYTLKMLEKIEDMSCVLIDLSLPMLNRAKERVSKKTKGPVQIIQADITTLELAEQQFDIIVAGAVLHHLRTDEDWKNVFTKIFRSLKPGGSFWISDLVTQESTVVNELMWNKYGDYLFSLGGEDFKQKVFNYIDKEDSPRSVTFQLDLMKECGFKSVDILHKNSCFAAFGGMKG